MKDIKKLENWIHVEIIILTVNITYDVCIPITEVYIRDEW